MAKKKTEVQPQDVDQPLNTTPTYTASHTFSTDDVTGTFDGATQGNIAPTDVQIVDFTATPILSKDGVELFPINSEFGFVVADFTDSVPKDFDLNPEYDEGFVGDLKDADGNQQGLLVADSPTDTFLTPARLGTWLVGIGGDTVKASTEHYSVMQNILSDQRYPGDPDALYALDDDLVMIGGAYDGQRVLDILPIVGDVNGDGVVDIRDVLTPSENTITQNIAASRDYSVTLKDDGKVLYRWGNEVKRPNDVRLETHIALPDEWKAEDAVTGLPKLYMVTQAELVVRHTITNNPNEQVRPEDLENEAATGRIPTYTVDGDGKWLSTEDFFAGDGTFLPAGTVLKDPALAAAAASSPLVQMGAASADLLQGYTAAWYITQDREPFEPILDGDGYEVGPRWRLKADKYGQDLPSVVIPDDPSAEPPPTKDEVKYDVGAPTQTVINLLDWKGVSPLTLSAGWQNAPGSVTINGLNLTEDFDIAFYVKGDQKPVTLYDAKLVMSYEEITVWAGGITITGTAGNDVLVGQGGNTFIGLGGEDLFVLSYGTTDNANLVSSTINDFQVGVDAIGLIGLDVSVADFAARVAQTVTSGNLVITLDGFEIATLIGVADELEITSFQIFSQEFGGTPVTATDGDDYLLGTDGNDTIDGLAGNDTILGLLGDDILLGGDGNDSLEGGDGNDALSGNAGDDVLAGGDGNDILGGGYGNDQLSGGAGDDILTGYRGTDLLEGGLGADVFIFASIADSSVVASDAITDFTSGDDLIDLSGIDANTNKLGDQAFTYLDGATAFSGKAGELLFRTDGTNGRLVGDVDGDGARDFRILLTGVTSMAEADFIL